MFIANLRWHPQLTNVSLFAPTSFLTPCLYLAQLQARAYSWCSKSARLICFWVFGSEPAMPVRITAQRYVQVWSRFLLAPPTVPVVSTSRHLFRAARESTHAHRGSTGLRPGAPRRMEIQLPSVPGGGSGGFGGKTRAATGSSGGSDSGGSFWDWYLQMLGQAPVLTKAITCSLLNGLGDLLCQLLVERKENVDTYRLLKFVGMGLFFVGPTLHVWYTWLNRMVPATGVKSAIVQMIWDQFFFAPLFLPAFITVLFSIDGKTADVIPKLKQDWFETVKANWILWIPAQYLNFRYVAPTLQVLVVNIVALAWNVYMSFQTNKAIAPTA